VATRAQPHGRLTAARILAFAAVFSVLQSAWQRWSEEPLGRWLVETLVVAPTAVLVNWLTPGVNAVADGGTVRAAGGGVRVLNGCEGFEAMFLLVAAVLVMPATPRQRLWGLAAGLPLIHALNAVRLLAMFYSFRRDPALFDTLHGLVMPLVMVAGVLAYFALWVRRVRKSHAIAA